jgi:hypothetical protein
MLIDWLQLCLRHGWIGNHARRNTSTPELRTADNRIQATLDARKDYGLDVPYGPAALACGARSTDELPPKKLDKANRVRQLPPES